jgi:hypothetical protein
MDIAQPDEPITKLKNQQLINSPFIQDLKKVRQKIKLREDQNA